MKAAVEFINVTKIYDYKTPKEMIAIKDLSFSVKKGEFVILMGPSGSGKSTVLSLVAALCRPTFGRVEVLGESLSKLPDFHAALFRREKIGFVFQRFNLIEDLDVFENVLAPLVPLDMAYEKAKERVEAVLRRFSIDHKSSVKVSKLSGGEMQRCAIARAFVNDPEILLADEPTANLDSSLTEEFISILKKIKAEGKTVLLSTHDQRFENIDFCDRILRIEDGRLICS